MSKHVLNYLTSLMDHSLVIKESKGNANEPCCLFFYCNLLDGIFCVPGEEGLQRAIHVVIYVG